MHYDFILKVRDHPSYISAIDLGCSLKVFIFFINISLNMKVMGLVLGQGWNVQKYFVAVYM